MATERPIFVVGYMHSGTTLVRNILANHAALYCAPQETKFFMHLNLVRADLGLQASQNEMLEYCRRIVTHGVAFRSSDRSATPKAPSRLSDRELGRRFRQAMDTLTLQAERARWVEKTPPHVFSADVIWSGIPDAMFLEVVRDPRDVLASKKTRTANVSRPGRFTPDERARKVLEKSFDALWDALSWKSAVRAGDNGMRSHPDAWLRIRYEDLVGQTNDVVRRVCSFFEIEHTAALLDVPRGIPADVDELHSPQRGIADSSTGRWREVLSPAEAGICERTCRREMAALGYASETTASLADVVGTVVTRSAPELFERVAHRYKLGGTPYLREIVGGYARRLRALVSGRMGQ